MIFKYLAVLLLTWNCLAEKKENKITRKIKQFRIPITCNDKNYTVAHFTATKDPEDVIHYIVSGRVLPTIIIRHVLKPDPVNIIIDNAAFCAANNTNQPSFKFSDDDKAQYSGIIISKIFPFDDQNDDIHLTDGKDSIFYNHDYVKNFTWLMEHTETQFPSSKPDVKFLGTATDENLGKIDFTVKIHDKDGNDDKLPGYPIRANLSEFKLELNGLPTKVEGDTNKEPILRYAVEVVFFTANIILPKAKFETKKSIDDEYTPGTFKLWGINFPLKSGNTYGAWKPVAYRKQKPSIENDAFAYNNIYAGGNKHMEKSGSLPPYTLFREWTLAYSPKQVHFALNVTFGQSKDGGYSPTNHYITWNGMIGAGEAPLNQDLSNFAITVITVGLGGPAVGGLLIGVLVAIIRRLRGSNTPKSKYDLIN